MTASDQPGPTKDPDITVHTLNARGNVMLEVTRNYFGLSAERMRREIAALHKRAVEVLASKGVAYAELRSALVPQADRREIALFFDSTNLGGWYGFPVHDAVLGTLHRKGSRAILSGDYIGNNKAQDLLYELFAEDVQPVQKITYRHSSQFYVVYVNNLTDDMFESMVVELSKMEGFVGYADMTYASRLKWYLSTILPNTYLQHRNTIISPHEDDRPDSDDVNLSGYPFEKHGFKVRSVPGDLEGVLLGYKIERPVFDGFETDTEFSLNAVTSSPLPLYELDIEIDQKKLDYLIGKKAESLKGAGLWGADIDALRKLIRDKLRSNYIYSMTYVGEHDTAKFNVMLEARSPADKPFRFLAALEFIGDERKIRLITLF
jgi:hypothetical protein